MATENLQCWDQMFGKSAPTTAGMLESGCASSVTFMALAQIAGGMGCRCLRSHIHCPQQGKAFALPWGAKCRLADEHNEYQGGWDGQEDEGLKL